ncbi:hypothetical protein K1719_034652 [Acacia pycnantha]|nr:hypothetical protein K1719_034652 [Acacia pycnantha]
MSYLADIVLIQNLKCKAVFGVRMMSRCITFQFDADPRRDERNNRSSQRSLSSLANGKIPPGLLSKKKIVRDLHLPSVQPSHTKVRTYVALLLLCGSPSNVLEVLEHGS